MSSSENFQSPEREAYIKETVGKIKSQLKEYADEQGLAGLEGRVERGLDPAGLWAVQETRECLMELCQKLGASPEDAEKLTKELHVGAIWDNADRLAGGSDPDIKAWMIAADSGRDKEEDLSPEEFVADYERIKNFLTEAVSHPEQAAEKAHQNLIEKSKEQFEVDEDGVPVSDLDTGFLAMAVNGYTAGVVRDKDALLFVGAKELDYSRLEELGLNAEGREDRGRMATFYTDEQGQDVVKKLYPGFAIILSKDMSVARELARTALEEKESQ